MTEVPVDTVKQHPACQSQFVSCHIQDAAIDEHLYYLYYEALIRQFYSKIIMQAVIALFISNDIKQFNQLYFVLNDNKKLC